MKKTILLLAQPNHQYAYWVESAFEGMKSTASKYALFIEQTNIERVLKKNIQGAYVLVIGHTSEWIKKQCQRLCNTGARPILVNNLSTHKNKSPYSGLYFDNEEMILDSINYFVAAGRKKIALIGPRMNDPPTHEKRKAFSRYTKALRLDRCDMFLAKADQEETYGLERFVSENRFKDFDAVFCTNNTFAVKFVKRAVRRGVKIPEDLFVMGDGNSFISEYLKPSVTVADLEYDEIGKAAVKLWRFLNDFGISSAVNVRVPSRIIARESTAFFEPEKTLNNIDLSELSGVSEVPKWDKETDKILQIEHVLQLSDDIDKQIVLKNIHNLTYEKIAEANNLSARAVRYRASKLIEKSGFKDIKEFYNAVWDVFC